MTKMKFSRSEVIHLVDSKAGHGIRFLECAISFSSGCYSPSACNSVFLRLCSVVNHLYIPVQGQATNSTNHDIIKIKGDRGITTYPQEVEAHKLAPMEGTMIIRNKKKIDAISGQRTFHDSNLCRPQRTSGFAVISGPYRVTSQKNQCTHISSQPCCVQANAS